MPPVEGATRKKRAVLFDLGGTLLVMRRDRIFHKVLTEAGYSVSLERIHSAYLSIEPQWLTRYGNKQLSPKETEEAYRVKDTMAFCYAVPERADQAPLVSSLATERWPELEKQVPYELYPDAEPLLARLSSEGYLTGLVSNAPPDARKVVEALGLHKYMQSIVISGSVGCSKPGPEIFRLALRDLGAVTQEAVHVGDVFESDVVGARSAGVEGILIDRDGSRGAYDCPRISNLGEVYRFLA